MKVLLGEKEIALDEKKELGSGGEAVVYSYQGKAIKIYHPNMLNPEIIEKLQNFPRVHPGKLIGPETIVTDMRKNVIGYAMPQLKSAINLIAFARYDFAQTYPRDEKKIILLDALKTLTEMNAAGIVAGDLNSLDILFRDHDAYFIDADSMQFGPYPCVMFTEVYLDPKLYGRELSQFAYSPESDRYAFAVIVFESLLLTHPFGGVHPKYATMARRANARVSVYQSGVIYPKAGIHFKVLPDELNDYFLKVFERDERGEFPAQVLSDMRWTKCGACGLDHARNSCPHCFEKTPTVVKETIVVNRQCVAKIVFHTKGRIILAKLEHDHLQYLFEENGVVKRESNQRVLIDKPDHFTIFDIYGEKTLIGKQNLLMVIEKEKIKTQTATGMLGNLPVLGTSNDDYFRLHGDYLVRGENKIVGSILAGRTWLKVGPRVGFGFYRLGLKTVYFIFNTNVAGINDQLKLPSIKGNLIDADCFFSDTHILFLYSAKVLGKIINSMFLLDNLGNLLASVSATREDSKILEEIHNHALGGDKIITSTDAGLILSERSGEKIREAKKFPDTQPFVTNQSRLLVGREGIYVVGNQSIKLLKLV